MIGRKKAEENVSRLCFHTSNPKITEEAIRFVVNSWKKA